MKKLTLAIIIIGSFIIFSLVYNHANSVAVAPSNPGIVEPSGNPNAATPTVSGSSGSTPNPTQAPGALYKDGTYTGSVADAFWGNLQVQAVIQNGKIANVVFLQYPNDRNRSIEINSYADPQLVSEAIQAQSANVDIVSGATDSSDAFVQSLTDALSQATA
ncbi:MAG TPA: FMN-binding protein [Ktedonobacteraceae bacterium]|nr:FMN-binding protein [Ktedonobacteraceae bacterium]